LAAAITTAASQIFCISEFLPTHTFQNYLSSPLRASALLRHYILHFQKFCYTYFPDFLYVPITTTGRSLSEVPQQKKLHFFKQKILTYHHHWALALSEVPQQVDQKQRLCLDRNSQYMYYVKPL
jgi:hypothetical protein